MLVFGCAWKINFSENIFSWLCVLIALTRKLVLVKIFTSNHFWTHAQRERERESPDHAFSEDHAFDFADLRIDLRTHESIIDPEPSTHKPWTLPATQSLCAMNPRTDLSVWFWSTHELIYVFVWFWFFTFSLWSLIFFFFFFVVVVWVVVFWWFSCFVVVGFVWVVVENSIFRMLPNTWKYFLEKFL